VQRYKALAGYEQRFQNGVDCQGLWVEVEVEKTLGFNSKREIESFGLERFSLACRDRVLHFAEVQTEQSRRLGQWMDWPRSYFTMSDVNIEYNWHFLKHCHGRGWLYRGHRPMPCVRGVEPRSRSTRCSMPTPSSRTSRSRSLFLSWIELITACSSGRRRHGRCRPTWRWPSTRSSTTPNAHRQAPCTTLPPVSPGVTRRSVSRGVPPR